MDRDKRVQERRASQHPDEPGHSLSLAGHQAFTYL